VRESLKGFADIGKSLREDLLKASQGEESWEVLIDEEGNSTGLQDSWGEGFQVRMRLGRGLRVRVQVVRGLRGASKAWEGSQESPQEQYYSSCNRKKPLINVGRFFTCNTCRERIREQTGPGTRSKRLII
jgi:hypothetical protein